VVSWREQSKRGISVRASLGLLTITSSRDVRGTYTQETTNIGPDQWNTKDIKVQHPHNRPVQVVVVRVVVAGPMRHMVAAAWEGRACQHERSLVGTQILQRLARCNGFGQAKQIVRVVLERVVVVHGSHVERLDVERVAVAAVVDGVRWVGGIGGRSGTARARAVGRTALLGRALAGAEVGDLVHVDPQAVDRHDAEEVHDLCLPPRLRLWVQKVGKDHVLRRPHMADEWLAAGIANESARVDQVGVGRVAAVDLDSWIENHYVLLALRVQLLHERVDLRRWVVDGIERKVQIRRHVINVIPWVVQERASK
jgi:hypothetical protein